MKLNNKGYLIVEVILASVLTFTMAYFLINLTLKIRNRYDDVNVETVMLNDKTIITNEIMDDVIGNNVNNVEYITNGIKINFNDGSSKDLTIVDNTITYGTYTKKFSENAIVGEASIRRNGNYFLVEIPIATKYSNKDYGINIVGFTKEALAPLTCSLSASSSKITASFDGNMVYYGWDENYKGSNNSDMDIAEGTYTYYMKDAFGNTGNCSIEVVKVGASCETGYTLNDEKTSCSKTYNPSWEQEATGFCECVGTGDTIGGQLMWISCSINGWGIAFCGCPTGYIVNSNYCGVNSVQKCSSNDTLKEINGEKICYSYKSVKQGCPDGYNNVGNEYCAK